ncbi:hypothetical protein HHK36_020670 [Tetracentron sinense]|uniref:Uncharacterized protein n=1 Tax=Tetracentron sinense TaxID=13715 RepID=A0A834Z080_TETSI|nr:hypothetical protein HHK36_020670 [Tetracentron sinense]
MEWQAQQREKTKELRRRRQEEDEEEERKVEEYREIGTRLKGYPEEEVREARRLVSSFIKAAEEVEEAYDINIKQASRREAISLDSKLGRTMGMFDCTSCSIQVQDKCLAIFWLEEEQGKMGCAAIVLVLILGKGVSQKNKKKKMFPSSRTRGIHPGEVPCLLFQPTRSMRMTLSPGKIEEAAEKGELTELILMVIWNRLDLARRDVRVSARDNHSSKTRRVTRVTRQSYSTRLNFESSHLKTRRRHYLPSYSSDSDESSRVFRLARLGRVTKGYGRFTDQRKMKRMPLEVLISYTEGLRYTLFMICMVSVLQLPYKGVVHDAFCFSMKLDSTHFASSNLCHPEDDSICDGYSSLKSVTLHVIYSLSEEEESRRLFLATGQAIFLQRQTLMEEYHARLYDWLYGRKYLESLDPHLLSPNEVWFNEKTHTHQEYISTEEICVDNSSWFHRQERSIEMDFKTLNKTVKTGLEVLSFKIETRLPDNLSEAIELIIDLYYDTNLDTKLETLEQNLETKIVQLHTQIHDEQNRTIATTIYNGIKQSHENFVEFTNKISDALDRLVQRVEQSQENQKDTLTEEMFRYFNQGRADFEYVSRKLESFQTANAKDTTKILNQVSARSSTTQATLTDILGKLEDLPSKIELKKFQDDLKRNLLGVGQNPPLQNNSFQIINDGREQARLTVTNLPLSSHECNMLAFRKIGRQLSTTVNNRNLPDIAWHSDDKTLEEYIMYNLQKEQLPEPKYKDIFLQGTTPLRDNYEITRCINTLDITPDQQVIPVFNDKWITKYKLRGYKYMSFGLFQCRIQGLHLPNSRFRVCVVIPGYVTSIHYLDQFKLVIDTDGYDDTIYPFRHQLSIQYQALVMFHDGIPDYTFAYNNAVTQFDQCQRTKQWHFVDLTPKATHKALLAYMLTENKGTTFAFGPGKPMVPTSAQHDQFFQNFAPGRQSTSQLERGEAGTSENPNTLNPKPKPSKHINLYRNPSSGSRSLRRFDTDPEANVFTSTGQQLDTDFTQRLTACKDLLEMRMLQELMVQQSLAEQRQSTPAESSTPIAESHTSRFHKQSRIKLDIDRVDNIKKALDTWKHSMKLCFALHNVWTVEECHAYAELSLVGGVKVFITDLFKATDDESKALKAQYLEKYGEQRNVDGYLCDLRFLKEYSNFFRDLYHLCGFDKAKDNTIGERIQYVTDQLKYMKEAFDDQKTASKALKNLSLGIDFRDEHISVQWGCRTSKNSSKPFSKKKLKKYRQKAHKDKDFRPIKRKKNKFRKSKTFKELGKKKDKKFLKKKFFKKKRVPNYRKDKSKKTTGKEFLTCGKEGHFASQCPDKDKQANIVECMLAEADRQDLDIIYPSELNSFLEDDSDVSESVYSVMETTDSEEESETDSDSDNSSNEVNMFQQAQTFKRKALLEEETMELDLHDFENQKCWKLEGHREEGQENVLPLPDLLAKPKDMNKTRSAKKMDQKVTLKRTEVPEKMELEEDEGEDQMEVQNLNLSGPQLGISPAIRLKIANYNDKSFIALIDTGAEFPKIKCDCLDNKCNSMCSLTTETSVESLLDVFLTLIENHHLRQAQERRDRKKDLNKVKQDTLDLLKTNLSTSPTDKWNVEKLICTLVFKDPEKTIKGRAFAANPDERKELARQVAKLLSSKLIRESTSRHSSTAFLVDNYSGQVRGEPRMTIDYRLLNNNTIDENYQIPLKDNLIQLIMDKKWFSKFNCKSGFWQFAMNEESIPWTAFPIPQGKYEWQTCSHRTPVAEKQLDNHFQQKKLKKSDNFSRVCEKKTLQDTRLKIDTSKEESSEKAINLASPTIIEDDETSHPFTMNNLKVEFRQGLYALLVKMRQQRAEIAQLKGRVPGNSPSSYVSITSPSKLVFVKIHYNVRYHVPTELQTRPVASMDFALAQQLNEEMLPLMGIFVEGFVTTIPKLFIDTHEYPITNTDVARTLIDYGYLANILVWRDEDLGILLPEHRKIITLLLKCQYPKDLDYKALLGHQTGLTSDLAFSLSTDGEDWWTIYHSHGCMIQTQDIYGSEITIAAICLSDKQATKETLSLLTNEEAKQLQDLLQDYCLPDKKEEPFRLGEEEDRVERASSTSQDTEILKREATPAMRLLNDLLNIHDGFDDEGWLKKCKKRMVDTFPREDPFSILVPTGFDIDTHQGQLRPPLEADDPLLRVDFVREVDALLQEVRSEHGEAQTAQGLDAESVASRLKQQEKQRTIHQVEALLDIAITMKW